MLIRLGVAVALTAIIMFFSSLFAAVSVRLWGGDRSLIAIWLLALAITLCTFLFVILGYVENE
jgi:hypothetical protein